MKKKNILFAGMMLALSSCGGLGTTTSTNSTSSALGSVLGNVIGSSTSTSSLTNILLGVIGANTLSEDNITGTWKYQSPGCAFTSENALAKAGGEVVSSQVVSKLQPTYNKLGISSSNTQFTLNSDKSFSGKVGGKSISGTYTYDSSTGAIQLKSLLLNLNGYLTRTSNGMSLTFESKKLLSALQLIGSASGNSTLSTVSDLSKNYDGIRLGFDMSR